MRFVYIPCAYVCRIRVSRVCLFTGAAVLAAVESAAVSGFVSRGRAGVSRWVWMLVRFVCVLRVSACALVCPVCVPAPPGVFLPVPVPVLYYR